MSSFFIGDIPIGPEHPPVLIAELGINHGGSLNEAKKLVDAAIGTGVRIIKHQTHVPEDEMSHHAMSVIPGNSSLSIYRIIQECSLSEADEFELKSYIESKNMIFISTPFSREAVHRLIRMNVSAFKVGSGECNNLPLIDLIASHKKPVVLSTGMNSLESVKRTVTILEKHRTPYALLHTTNLYPTPHHLVRLGAMQQLMEHFKDTVVGLSDHTIDNFASFAAVALGAKIIERHFTDSKARQGPDIANSMDPKECRELVRGIELIHRMLGGQKIPAIEEKVTSDFAFASVVSTTRIERGSMLTRDNIWVKRPGTGEISAEKFETLLGRRVIRDIESDEQISFGDIESLDD